MSVRGQRKKKRGRDKRRGRVTPTSLSQAKKGNEHTEEKARCRRGEFLVARQLGTLAKGEHVTRTRDIWAALKRRGTLVRARSFPIASSVVVQNRSRCEG